MDLTIVCCIVGTVFGLLDIVNIIFIFRCPENIGEELAFAAIYFIVSALFFVLAFEL